MWANAGIPEADPPGRLLNELTWQVQHTLKVGDSSSVHDLRVGIRRARQALAAFLPGKTPKQLQARLKTIMVLAGEVRDCDITINLIDKSELAGLAALRARCQLQRDKAWLTLTHSLKRWLARPGRIAASGEPLEETAERVLAMVAKDFFRRGAAAANGASPKELHKFRIAAKKFRYTLELFGSSLRPWVARVEKIQTLLGRVNDYESARRLAADLGGRKKLDAYLKKQQEKKIKEFHRLWTSATANKLRRKLQAELLYGGSRLPTGKP